MSRTTQRKGDIASAQAVAYFTKQNYDVSIPLTESAPYDLLVDLGDSIKRVKVKFTSVGEVDLRNIHSNASGYVVKKVKRDSYDWLYIYTKDGRQFLIKKCLHGRRSITCNSSFEVFD